MSDLSVAFWGKARDLWTACGVDSDDGLVILGSSYGDVECVSGLVLYFE